MVGRRCGLLIGLCCASIAAAALAVVDAQSVGPKTDSCQDAAQAARRTLKIYDEALRNVWHVGADRAALDNLTATFNAVSSEYAAILRVCGRTTNSAPVVAISAPADGAAFPSGATIQLSGSASDAEDGSLAAAIRWSSSQTGYLGAGPALSVVLPDGAHAITADVSDSQGLHGSATIHVTVGGQVQPPPPISILAISPNMSFVGTALPVVITAQDPPPQGCRGFEAGATVVFKNSGDSGSGWSVAASVLDAATLVAILPKELPAGVYDVYVTNVDQSSGVLPRALTRTDHLGIYLAGVSPTEISGSNESTVLVAAEHNPPVGSELLMAGAFVQFFEQTQGTALLPKSVTFVDSYTLSVVIGAGSTPGVYDLVVINPDGVAGLVPGALTIKQ